jgi:peptidoglycan/LPS O-acetylase OafA/YrhL
MKLEMVQSLRGLAAMMVVLMHFKIFLDPVAPGISSFLGHGYLGVDVFFILSGFIIYVSTAGPDARSSHVFLFRRFCRVVLPAWAAMMVAALVRPPHLKDLAYGFFFIPLENAIPPFFGYSFLIVAWTLTYELIFYTLFAAVLATPLGRRHRGLCASALLLACVCGIQLLQQCCTLDPQQGPLVMLKPSYLPGQLVSLLGNPILLEFAVGIFLGWAYLQGVFQRVSSWMLLVVGPLMFYLTIRFQFVEGHGLTRGGPLAAAIVCYALALQGWWLRRGAMRTAKMSSWWPIGWACIFLGDISYSLYLIHPSIKAAMSRYDGWPTALPAVYGKFALALLVTVLLSTLFYRWIELPAQKLGRNLSVRWSAKPVPVA